MADVGPIPPHRHALAIEPGDIDFMGHVNNSVYLEWVQEAVIAYWRRVAPAEAVAGMCGSRSSMR